MLPDKVSVLILGGTVHVSRPFLKWLLTASAAPTWEGPVITHIRLVDKFLIAGAATSTFVDPDSLEAYRDARVEYRQANLNSPATLASVYKHPDGGSYEIVFDFTGEGISSMDVPEELLLERTTKLAHSIALESSRHRVKAHVRDTAPFTTTDVGAPAMKEGDVVAPRTARSYWWYEAERAVASVDDLPLAITRSAEVIGPFLVHGTVVSRYALGYVYKYLDEPMKLFWGPELRTHAIHVDDWCPAAWKVALWTASHTRHEANAKAGEDLPPVRIKDKLQHSMREKVAAGCCPRDQTPRAPVFNLVDDTDLTQGKLLKMAGETFGIETGFTNAFVNAWARLNLASVVNEINEKHSEAIVEIMEKSGLPPSPLSGWLDLEMVANRSVAFDNAKIKSIIGWQPHVRIDKEHLDDILTKMKDLGMFRKSSPRD